MYVPKVMVVIRSTSPRHKRNPDIRIKTTTIETCTLMMTKRKRCKALSRTGPTTKATTPRVEPTEKAKRKTSYLSQTRVIPRETKNRSREHNKHQKNSNGDRRKLSLYLCLR
jgi:hypothetical protein